MAKTYLGTGRTGEEIVELAEEIGAGMIVVGNRGIDGVRRALMKSDSDSVVRHVNCSVLVVREAPQNHREFRLRGEREPLIQKIVNPDQADGSAWSGRLRGEDLESGKINDQPERSS